MPRFFFFFNHCCSAANATDLLVYPLIDLLVSSVPICLLPSRCQVGNLLCRVPVSSAHPSLHVPKRDRMAASLSCQSENCKELSCQLLFFRYCQSARKQYPLASVWMCRHGISSSVPLSAPCQIWETGNGRGCLPRSVVWIDIHLL